ncbi:hypothetical protein F2P81_023907 [Scophthalmus maximus]|uniref:Uncharacterized protein n=1 Tax=Scophthalmus maximus TaxID=52904 RepID=A0A6A4RSK4_SCOMX|nr:hypothetical protein F2P81_023907 [Scophthalmus maximus]
MSDAARDHQEKKKLWSRMNSQLVAVQLVERVEMVYPEKNPSGGERSHAAQAFHCPLSVGSSVNSKMQTTAGYKYDLVLICHHKKRIILLHYTCVKRFSYEEHCAYIRKTGEQVTIDNFKWNNLQR